MEAGMLGAGPCVVDVHIAEHENVLPMVPPGASNLEMIVHTAESID